MRCLSLEARRATRNCQREALWDGVRCRVGLDKRLESLPPTMFQLDRPGSKTNGRHDARCPCEQAERERERCVALAERIHLSFGDHTESSKQWRSQNRGVQFPPTVTSPCASIVLSSIRQV